jgi:hypothetical protein
MRLWVSEREGGTLTCRAPARMYIRVWHPRLVLHYLGHVGLVHLLPCVVRCR